MVVKSTGKKKRTRCPFGPDCQGCKVPECGECVYCLDRPSRGGPGIKKQKCRLRKCSRSNRSKSSFTTKSSSSASTTSEMEAKA